MDLFRRIENPVHKRASYKDHIDYDPAIHGGFKLNKSYGQQHSSNNDIRLPAVCFESKCQNNNRKEEQRKFQHHHVFIVVTDLFF